MVSKKIIVIGIFIFLLVDILLFILIKIDNLSQLFPLKNTKNITQKINNSISITTDTGTVSGKIINELALREALNRTHFWDTKGVTLFKPSGFQTNNISVTNLVIHVTDKIQPLGHIFGVDKNHKQYIYEAFGMNFDINSQTLNLYLFVSPDLIVSRSSKDLDIIFSYVFLSSVFDVTHPLLPEYKSFEERLKGKSDFIKTMLGFSHDTLFLINKK